MYHDRRDAGRRVAAALAHLQGQPRLVILGMARGGVPVAAEVARVLGAPLDVVVVRKIGVPWNPELALGAIAAGAEYLDPTMIRITGTGEAEVRRTIAHERAELARREARYRAGRAALSLADATVVVVDDGLATGASAIAALRALRTLGPRRLIFAAPVGPGEAVAAVAREADEVVCPERPEPFVAVGHWYRDFSQTSDAEVQACLADPACRPPATAASVPFP